MLRHMNSNQISQEDLDRIRALAKEATPGPWEYNEAFVLVRLPDETELKDMAKPRQDTNIINVNRAFGPDVCKANAEYIAAANPQMMLSLADFIERLEAEIANLEREKIAYYKAFDKLAEKLGVLQETDPGKPETFEVFAKVFERQEKEADWLADKLRELCPHFCQSEDCTECWREAARNAVENKND